MSLALDPTESAVPVEGEYSSWRLERVPTGGVPLEIRIYPNVLTSSTSNATKSLRMRAILRRIRWDSTGGQRGRKVFPIPTAPRTPL
jgi:hypothetical protein